MDSHTVDRDVAQLGSAFLLGTSRVPILSSLPITYPLGSNEGSIKDGFQLDIENLSFFDTIDTICMQNGFGVQKSSFSLQSYLL
jgi:hypothetical protein